MPGFQNNVPWWAWTPIALIVAAVIALIVWSLMLDGGIL